MERQREGGTARVRRISAHVKAVGETAADNWQVDELVKGCMTEGRCPRRHWTMLCCLRYLYTCKSQWTHQS